MKKLLATILALILICTMSLAFAEQEKLTIGFSTRTLTNEPFQSAVLKGVQEAVEAAGHEIVIMTTDTASNSAMQVSQIEDLINMGVDGLIYVPLDNISTVECLQSAKEKGIPVVIIDSALQAGYEDLYVSFVGTNGQDAGYVLGEMAVEQFPDGGNVIIARAAPGVQAIEDRCNGFLDAIANSGLEVVDDQYSQGTNETVMEIVSNMLVAHPDVDVLYLPADAYAEGAVQAIDDANLDHDVVIYGVDGSNVGLTLMEEGRIAGLSQQQPAKMGSISVEILLSILSGEKTPEDWDKVIDSGTLTVTPENIEEGWANGF